VAYGRRSARVAALEPRVRSSCSRLLMMGAPACPFSIPPARCSWACRLGQYAPLVLPMVCHAPKCGTVIWHPQIDRSPFFCGIMRNYVGDAPNAGDRRDRRDSRAVFEFKINPQTPGLCVSRG
jgi:hypothetical protein